MYDFGRRCVRWEIYTMVEIGWHCLISLSQRRLSDAAAMKIERNGLI